MNGNGLIYPSRQKLLAGIAAGNWKSLLKVQASFFGGGEEKDVATSQMGEAIYIWKRNLPFIPFYVRKEMVTYSLAYNALPTTFEKILKV